MPGRPASTLTPEQLRERRNAYSRKYYAKKREAKKALEEITKQAEEVKTQESSEIETLKNHLITCVNMINEMTIALNELKKVKEPDNLAERIEEYKAKPKTREDYIKSFIFRSVAEFKDFDITSLQNVNEFIDDSVELLNVPKGIKSYVDWPQFVADCVSEMATDSDEEIVWIHYNDCEDIRIVTETDKERYLKELNGNDTLWGNSYIVKYNLKENQ